MPTQNDYSKYPQEIAEAWKAWGADKFWRSSSAEDADFRIFTLGWDYATGYQAAQRMMPPQPPQEYDALTRQDINIIINYLARISYNTSNIIWPEPSTISSP